MTAVPPEGPESPEAPPDASPPPGRRRVKPPIDRSAWGIGVPHTDPVASVVETVQAIRGGAFAKAQEEEAQVEGTAAPLPPRLPGAQVVSPALPVVDPALPQAPDPRPAAKRSVRKRKQNSAVEAPDSPSEGGEGEELCMEPVQGWIVSEKHMRLRLYSVRTKRPLRDLIREAIDDLLDKLGA